MSNSPYQQLLSRHFSVWQQLSKQQQEALLENTMLMTYTKGRNLHSSSKDCAGLILVKSGMLRIYMLSDAGKEITLYRLNPGDICVLSASCVLSTITFEVHIDAECDTQALLIQAPFFSALCQQNIYVECFAYKLATERFSDVMWAMQQLLFMRMDQRLALFLQEELAKTTGNTIHITHEQVARYLGSAREVVTRMLHYFTAEGIVTLSRGEITIINWQKLQKIIES